MDRPEDVCTGSGSWAQEKAAKPFRSASCHHGRCKRERHRMSDLKDLRWENAVIVFSRFTYRNHWKISKWMSAKKKEKEQTWRSEPVEKDGTVHITALPVCLCVCMSPGCTTLGNERAQLVTTKLIENNLYSWGKSKTHTHKHTPHTQVHITVKRANKKKNQVSK